MNLNKDVEIFDYICIGTSVIASLEAAYQSSKGYKVLMVDRETSFGGAWKSIELEGIKDIENAIHYLNPDDRGIEFLKKDLGCAIEISKKKHRYFNFHSLGYLKLQYDSLYGRLLNVFFESDGAQGLVKRLSGIFRALYEAAKRSKTKSCYLVNGSLELVKTVRRLLYKAQVEIRLSSNIEHVFFDLNNQIVKCQINGHQVFCKALILGHGARLHSIESTEGAVNLEEKIHPRPAYHLLVDDDKESDTLEAVFVGDLLIKYVHDVSRFSSIESDKEDRRKIFVFALHSDIEDTLELANELFLKLQNIGLIGENSKILASVYSEVFLPRLYDEDLYHLKHKFGDLVNILRTENLSHGLGYYAEKWRS